MTFGFVGLCLPCMSREVWEEEETCLLSSSLPLPATLPLLLPTTSLLPLPPTTFLPPPSSLPAFLLFPTLPTSLCPFYLAHTCLCFFFFFLPTTFPYLPSLTTWQHIYMYGRCLVCMYMYVWVDRTIPVSLPFSL